MEKQQKPKEVEWIKERFQKANGLIFSENKGLKVSEVTALRKKLKAQKITLKVVKNRLVKRALKDISVSGLDDFFRGPTLLTAAEADPVTPAKILVEFAKENERLNIKGGFLDGAVLSRDKIEALAMLPSKEELFAKLLGCMLGPARNLVNVLAAVPRQLVTVVEAIGKQKN